MTSPAESIIYEFDNYRVDGAKRLLWNGGDRPIPLKPKVFDTLLYLISKSGGVIEKDELMSAIWPDTIVEENNLNKNISVLRRVLGENPSEHRFIVTVPGKGYKFVAAVKEITQPSESLPRTAAYLANAALTPPVTSQNLERVSGTEARRFWLVTLTIAVLGGLFLVGSYTGTESREAPPISSIAVLRFVNVGGDSELAYLSDGLSEALIDRLSELPQLKVIARTSSFKFSDQNMDVREIAQKLGVRALVTGKVMRRGDDLSIRVELIDAHDNKQLWGEQFNRKMVDAVAIHREISRAVSRKLHLKLSGEQEHQIAKGDTTDEQAYELLLKGDYLYRTGQAEKLAKAIEYYQQAIVLDPNYALAHARIARIYVYAANSSLLDPDDALPKAKAAAQKAIELDENLADAHLQLANLAVDEWDWPLAERKYVQALVLNPNHSEAHRRYSGFLSVMARHEEAIVEAKRASELDPERLTSRMTFLTALLLARRSDEAIVESRKILVIEPNHRGAFWSLSHAYSQKGMYVEAVRYMESKPADDEPPASRIWLGTVYAHAGERQKARAILQRLEITKTYVSPAELAILYTALGEREKAFASLLKAYVAHDLQLKYLNADSNYDPLREDRRFQDLVRDVGLPSNNQR